MDGCRPARLLVCPPACLPARRACQPLVMAGMLAAVATAATAAAAVAAAAAATAAAATAATAPDAAAAAATATAVVGTAAAATAVAATADTATAAATSDRRQRHVINKLQPHSPRESNSSHAIPHRPFDKENYDRAILKGPFSI